LQIGTGDRQRQAGEAAAASHIDDPRPLGQIGCRREAVRKMTEDDLVRLGNGGHVMDTVEADQMRGKCEKGLAAIGIPFQTASGKNIAEILQKCVTLHALRPPLCLLYR